MTMQTQDIFKAFGANWTWASVDKAGAAWVHTYKPNAGSQPKHQQILNARANAFDTKQPQEERTSWARTDFSNGPTYNTDEFGIGIPSLPGAPPPAPVMPTQQIPAPLPDRGYCSAFECFNEKAVGFNVCEAHRPPQLMAPVMPTDPWSSTPAQVPMAPPTQTRLTTEEAENGKLWDFAKVHENYVLVDALGGVHFSGDVVGVPRYAFDVVVDGVTHPIERTRSQPQLAPPEAGKPFVDKFDAQPAQLCNVFDCTAPALPGDLCCKGHATHHSKLAVPLMQPRFDYQPAHPGLRDDGLEPPEAADEVEPDEPHGWFDRVDELEKELAKAKLHARLLLNSYDQHGEAELPLSIYLAIFGEQPE